MITKIPDMRKFDYVMIFTIYSKKITSQGSISEFYYQLLLKDYVTGVHNHYVIRLTLIKNFDKLSVIIKEMIFKGNSRHLM